MRALSIIHLHDEAQAEALDRRGTFTTMTQEGTRRWPATQVALLTAVPDDDDERQYIVELGTVQRSHGRVATGWHRLRYIRHREVTPVAASDLLAAVPGRLRETLADRLSSGGVLPPASAAATARALEALNPAAGRELRRLLSARAAPRPRLPEPALQAAAQEADAVRLAVDIADIPRRTLRDTHPDGQVPFLARLEDVRTREDTAIAYDSMRFLDFQRIEHPSGIVRFSKGYERLTVINVNRQPLERTLGADLIYINETLESFVLVQYKTMRAPANGADGPLSYRPDQQLAEELERLRAIAPGGDDGAPESYRLNPGCAYLKLCKPVTRLDHPVGELVGGMYLPLDYYEILAASDETRGPRGGVIFSYQTVQRRLGNDLFIRLVRDAWIGTRGEATAQLTELVLAELDAERSVTVASASTADEPDWSDA